MKSSKPVVVVSKCLGFDACRYNGISLPDKLIDELGEFVTYLPVCPEVEIGLGVPRDPIRVVRSGEELALYQPATGRDATAKMRAFAESFLDSLDVVHGFILKNRSPSCGPADVKVYASRDDPASSSRGTGMFAQAVIDRFGGLAIEDEGRLKNYKLRDHFLTKLFALAELGDVATDGSAQALVDFHTRHKLLLMGYSQSRLQSLGRIVANHQKLAPREVFAAYEEQMQAAMAKPAKSSSMVNVLHHALGGVSEQLSAEEREFFINTVEEYRDERVPLSVPVRLIASWAVRFGNTYLQKQTLLRPYPYELVHVTDSGKGRAL